MKKSKLTLRCLCEAAIMIALAQILGYLKLYELPQGGSITLSMLPIFLFCSRWGFGPGMLASFAFSLLPLFLDGARLGYGLASPETDVTLEDIAGYTDVFYIGGTKVGALCGEAVVFTKKAPKHFMTMVKQQGALLAKGRLLGIQFDTLFTDDLYTKISKNAIETAMKLKKALQEKGYQLYLDSPTNQQFVVLENKKKEELGKKVQFDFWEKYDEDHTVIRFATSWGTKMEDIDALIELL